ncbi:MAG TPA: SDR family oxidoreductase [Mycobacteriales bacterium]|nr:SDR family oxidoreductase [Mycobacteriales bacterium]
MAERPPKSVVVTGANSGIGLATCLELAKAGYDVIGTVRSDAKADLLRDEALARGLVVRSVLCEVTEAESVERAFKEVAAMTGGGPWAVVNNAGFVQPGAVEEVDDDDARRQLEVNLLAPARICRTVIPAMRERGDGRIVNVSSIAGRVNFPFMGWYHASKHALEALSDSLRMEVAQFGVKVILVEPGSFGTSVWAEGASRLPAKEDSPYASSYARSDLIIGNTGYLPDPVWVARTIRLALGTPMPLARYLVGVDAVSATVLDRVMPTVVADWVKGVATGVRSPIPWHRR